MLIDIFIYLCASKVLDLKICLGMEFKEQKETDRFQFELTNIIDLNQTLTYIFMLIMLIVTKYVQLQIL